MYWAASYLLSTNSVRGCVVSVMHPLSHEIITVPWRRFVSLWITPFSFRKGAKVTLPLLESGYLPELLPTQSRFVSSKFFPNLEHSFNIFRYMVDHHYLQGLYSWIYLLSKILFLTPKTNNYGAFMIILGHVQSSQKFEQPSAHKLSWAGTRWRSALMVQLSYHGCVLSALHLVPIFVGFCWWFHCLKLSLNVVMKCFLVFLNTKGWCVWWRKYVC